MRELTFLATGGGNVTRAAGGEQDEWSVGVVLENQRAVCLAADPLNPGVAYAGTHGNGVFRSDDGGRTWQPSGMAGQVVKSLAVSPLESGVLYAGTKPPALYVSADSGATWSEREGLRKARKGWWFTPAEEGDEYVQAIALSSTDPDVILAGIEFGAVLRSADGGRTFSGHRRGAIRDCHSMQFHATDGKWVYEGGASWGGGAVSSDGGVTFRRPAKRMALSYGWACAGDPVRPEVWYVSVANGPARAHGGENAEAAIYRMEGDAPPKRLAGGLPEPLPFMPYALVTDPAAPGHLYAGMRNGDIWHTADMGESWRQLPLNVGRISRAMVLLPA